VQNKANQIKMSAKISQAASYQAPVAKTLVKSEIKRKIEQVEPEKDEIDMFIAEETSIILKKPKYNCEYCDKTFKTSNEFCQHKRSQKHQRAE
jgi:hypothetical protein